MTITNAVTATIRGLWWLVLIRGILLVLLGVATIWQPFVAVLAFATVFGIYAIADGAMIVVAAIAARKEYQGWGWLVAQGVLTVLAGVLIVALPATAGLLGVFAVLWFLAISSVVGGALELTAAARHRGEGRGWGILAGVLDILFGVLLAVLAIADPAGTFVATVWLIGVGALVFGIILIFGAFRLRRATR